MEEELKDASWSFYSCKHGHGNKPCMLCHYVPGHIEESQAEDGTPVRTYVEAVIPVEVPDNWHETHQPGTGAMTDAVTIRTVP